jgi:Xaa-Pro aminopeptidase
MGDSTTFARRRAAYMEAIGERGTAVVHSPPEATRNGDVHFPFRQSSDLLYLTGFPEPETTLVLRPGAEDHKVVMFVRPRDPERETWDGRRAGVDGAMKRYGADQAYSIAELDKRLPELIANFDDLHYSVGIDPEFDARVMKVIAQLRATDRRGKRPPLRIVDPRAALHEMRMHKDAEEVELLRKAAAISAEAHIEAMKLAAPGVNEYQLEAIIDYTFRRHGGTGPGYNTIVGGGENATILHYIENDQPLSDGDLVLIDAGCEYQGYTADITRTFPASGTFTEVQRRCYDLVLDCQVAAIEMCKPGATILAIHEMCVERLTQGMVDLGLLEGPAADRIEDESYKRFYMHRTSHWLGMDVHDVGAYTERDGSGDRPLAAGMVVTIEPGLYIASDAENVPDELRGIGIRIEDDILITEDGCENLTAAVPKQADEVEAACRS